MLDHQCQISIPAKVARGSIYVSILILYSLAYDTTDVMDYDILTMALSAQVQVSIVLIGIELEPSVEPIVLAKQCL